MPKYNLIKKYYRKIVDRGVFNERTIKKALMVKWKIYDTKFSLFAGFVERTYKYELASCWKKISMY